MKRIIIKWISLALAILCCIKEVYLYFQGADKEIVWIYMFLVFVFLLISVSNDDEIKRKGEDDSII